MSLTTKMTTKLCIAHQQEIDLADRNRLLSGVNEAHDMKS